MKRNATWIGLLLVVTALFYWKLVLTSQFSLLTGAENVNQAYSWLSFETRCLRQGFIPLWDPFTFSGHSFAGELQTAAFYPVHWLLSLIPTNRDGLLPEHLYNYLFVVNHFLACVFMFLLMRDLRFERFIAFVSALCFSFGGFTGRVAWPHMLESAIWTPLLVLFALRLCASQTVRRLVVFVALSSATLGLSILAGGLHVVIMQVLMIVAILGYGGYLGKPAERQTRHWMTVALVAGAVIVGGCGIAAVQLLPSHEYALRSIRFLGPITLPSAQKIPYYYLQDRLSPQAFVTVLFPQAFDGTLGNGEAWVPYIGVFPFLLAMVGIVANWSKPWVRFWVVLGVVSLVYTFAEFTPVHGIAYALVPFLWMAREATRFSFLVQFGLCILAAYGLQALRSSALPEDTRLKLTRAAKWVALSVLAVISVPMIFGKVNLPPWTGLSLLLLLCGCGMLTLFVRRTSRSLALLAGIFIFVDLSCFNWIPRNKIEADHGSGDFQKTLESCRGVAKFLKKQAGPFRADAPSLTTMNLGDAFEVPIYHGGGVTFDDDFMNLNSNPDLLNIKYRITPASVQDPGEIYKDAAWKVYENPKAFPRAWMVHEVVPERIGGQADLHVSAVVADTGGIEIEPAAAGEPEQITWRHFDGQTLEVTADARSSGLLVFSEMYYPGWTASLNGQPARILRVDNGLRAVAVPPGKSSVSMRFEPSSIRIGGVISIAGAIFIVVALILLRAELKPLVESQPG